MLSAKCLNCYNFQDASKLFMLVKIFPGVKKLGSRWDVEREIDRRGRERERGGRKSDGWHGGVVNCVTVVSHTSQECQVEQTTDNITNFVISNIIS